MVAATIPDGDPHRPPRSRSARRTPDTWEDWLRIGKKGKAIGHPFGTALGHSADANTTLLSILWSYGGSYVAKDGETVHDQLA